MERHLLIRKVEFWTYLIALIAFVTGLNLTFVSWLELCSESCAAAHTYLFLGLSFEFFGFAFFAFCLVAHLLSYTFPFFGTLTAWGLAGAIGAELNFMRIQQYVIGSWCPICLSIAACLIVAAIAYTVEGIKKAVSEAKTMNQGVFKMIGYRSVVPICITILGFFISFFGVFSPDKAYAGTVEAGELSFGNKSSSIDVYVVTDWYCSGCQQMENKMKLNWPEIMQKARVWFIDFPVHRASKNFIPYNVSFMVNNKGKYIELREALHKLSKKTDKPKTKEVQKAIKPLGVVYKQLDFEDTDGAIQFFENVVRKYSVEATPSVVIANRKIKQYQILEGANEISAKTVLEKINELSGG